MGSIKLGKILGFEISLDWSWLFIFFLVVYTLAVGYFPTLYPRFDIATNWLVGVAAALLLFVSVLIHELSHSLVARSYGQEVKGIMLFLFGGVSQTTDEPKSAHDEFWMALVGPVTSFALAGIFYGLGRAGIAAAWPKPAIAILGYLAMINFFLGLFNLVPGFPLDGGRVLRSIIWSSTGDLAKATRYASYGGQAVGYAMIAVGFISILSGNLVGGLWFVFIGWFLTGIARSSYQQLLVRQALSGVPVSQVMTAEVPAIPADMNLRRFVDEYLLRHDYSCYPVTSGEDVLGVVGIEEVRNTPSDRWDTTTVGQVVHGLDGALRANESDDALDALTKLTQEGACRLIVLENGHLKGTVGRETVFRLVQTKMRLGI